MTFETAIEPLAETPIPVFVFCLLLAFDREDSVSKLDFNIPFLESRQLSRNIDFAVGFAEFDVRPCRLAIEDSIGSKRRHAETAESIVKQAVHLPMQGKERAGIFVAADLNVPPAIPGD